MANRVPLGLGSMDTRVTEQELGWSVVIHLVQTPNRDFRPQGLTWNWGSRDA